MVDAVTWFARPRCCSSASGSRPRAPGRGVARALADLREGWTFFRRTTWLWVVVLAFGFLNAIHIGALFTLGPLVAKDTIGEQGWGLRAVGRVGRTAGDDRRPAARAAPAAAALGMLGISLLGVPMVLLGADAAARRC